MTNQFTFGRANRADVPGRRGVRGGSVPVPLAGRLRLPGLREPERSLAQVGGLRPPVSRLPEADLGDGRDVHTPLACAAERLASGAVHHDRAFERDVGLAAAAPSELGKLQDGLDARPEDPTGDGCRRPYRPKGSEPLPDGWAGYDGLQNHTAVAVGDRSAHEVPDWIHRVLANLKRWGLGVLHGFRCKHLGWQLVEWSFRWNLRRRRGESFFALLDADLGSGAPRPGRTSPQPKPDRTPLRIAPSDPGRILRNRTDRGAKRSDFDQFSRICEPKARLRRDSTCCGCGLKAISHLFQMVPVEFTRQSGTLLASTSIVLFNPSKRQHFNSD